MDMHQRLERMEKRLARDTEHMMNALATQRQIVTKAFEQVQVSMLEQEMTIRSHTLGVQEMVGDLAQVVRELSDRVEALERKANPAA